MNSNVNIHIIQYIAILGSVLFIVFILNLIRKKQLKEAYALLWLFFTIIFLTLSIWRQGLDKISGMIGIAYAPAALFLTFLIAVFLILIQFSIVISKLSENNTKLAQEIGLLKLEMEQLKKGGK
jgi:hypothetical protein